MFYADKTRMIGLPYGEKLWRYVKPFSSNTGTLRADRQTDIIAISISRVTVLTRDKNQHWVYQIYVQQLLLTYTDAFYPGKRTWNKQLWGQEVKGQGHMRSKIDLEAWWHSKVTRLGVGQSRDLVKVNSAFFRFSSCTTYKRPHSIKIWPSLPQLQP